MMHAFANKLTLQGIIAFICLFLGCALQIQTTIGASETSFGLRVNLADLALPFLAAVVGISLLAGKSKLPRWHIRFGWFWPVALTGLIVFAFWNGYAATGELSRWALVNKFIGWFILMGYFGLGAWAVANAGDRVVRLFSRSFLYMFAAIVSVQGTYLLASDFGSWGDHFMAMRGLMGNRNALGVVILMVYSLLLFYHLAGRPLVRRQFLWGFLAALPLIFLLCGSRAALFAAVIPVLLMAIVFKKDFLKLLLIPVLTAMLIYPAMFLIHGDIGIARGDLNRDILSLTEQVLESGQNASEDTHYTGDAQRIRVFNDAISFWKNAPVTGIGLGSFLYLQQEKYGQDTDLVLGIVDSSPLWILTETGLIGVVLFAGFFIAVLQACWRRGLRESESDTAIFRTAFIAIALAFAGMSLFHELLYTRALWFMLGMAVAVGAKELERIRTDV